MQKKFEFIAPSADEAMDTAVQKLHIASDKIYVNVLGETEDGVNCEALVDVNLTLEGKKYLEGILKALGIGYQIEARSINGEEQIYYMIDSYENSLLIGVKGKTLEALQILLRNLISTYTKDHVITSLDIGGYRSNRARQLEILATKTAKEVVKTKVQVKLQPMNSYERRIIHEKLADWRDVYTESEGEGENRAIVIKPKTK
ncbi:spoIIIJ-associated protein [Anaeroplasma bactoclasticum]|jgi:spoIIIJ-associated protein|uniref:SpoIIIJ-associated protein n=1 Tax=Anaeroplasma bactoclasticum TaxID=2088 RepID=A0A397RVB0_9MOLU|nr:RNA-binding cell elongation regulator Jag/EloR [Anaeroplasma bactoclasticum]RIA75547.1 spoIIIJ-associated protein [Anaeroplasma bactoclasticum]